jgi:ABC-type amino acid transport substrate-binding protein
MAGSGIRCAVIIISGAILWPIAAGAQTNAAARVAPRGELRAALIASNPVLVSHSTSGELGGVSVELARAFASKLGVPIRFVPMTIRLDITRALARANGISVSQPAILHEPSTTIDS